MAAKTAGKQRLDLALQGGGAHGAFTWGVLDRLFEEDSIEIAGTSGTSAGAMNAAVMAHGLAIGGKAGARAKLTEFWQRVGDAARFSPLQPSPIDRWLGLGNIDTSPGWLAFDNLSRLLSPYELNPANYNPLRDILADVVDFAALADQCSRHVVTLFLCATNVENGRIKVFEGNEIGLDAVMASACLPYLFQAVEVNGSHYWDGGFSGNPPIFPLIYGTDCADVLIVQINPINITGVPKTARAILDRMNTLAFNSSLMREMRAIHFVTRLIDEERLDPDRYKRLNIHTIAAEDVFGTLGVSSKVNADPAFLRSLFELGRERCAQFLEAHQDKIGVESSTDIEATFF